MTDETRLHAIGGGLSSFWRHGRPAERAGYTVGTLLVISGLIHLGILIVSGGSWSGPLSLRKAVSFGLSFGLTLITIVWVSSFLRLADRTRATLIGLFTVACALETALVSLQVWRGVPSHFNVETPFDGFVARALAAGGVALVTIIGTLLVFAFRRDPTIPLSLLIAIRIGFLTLFTSLMVGASMIAKGMMLVFGGHPQAAYATGGTLKPTHFVTMHAILVLPLLAWLVSFADWSERRRVSVVLLGAAGYVVCAVVVATENIVNLPISETPLGAEVLFTFGVLGLLVAGALAVVGAVHERTSEPS